MRGGDTYAAYTQPHCIIGGTYLCSERPAIVQYEFIGSVLPLPPHVIYYSMPDNI